MCVIRIIAGGYLAYMAYSLLGFGGMDVYENSAEVPLYGKIAGVAFIVIGAYFVIDGIRRLLAELKRDKQREAEAEAMKNMLERYTDETPKEKKPLERYTGNASSKSADESYDPEDEPYGEEDEPVYDGPDEEDQEEPFDDLSGEDPEEDGPEA